jgi:hypothetical protein
MPQNPMRRVDNIATKSVQHRSNWTGIMACTLKPPVRPSCSNRSPLSAVKNRFLEEDFMPGLPMFRQHHLALSCPIEHCQFVLLLMSPSSHVVVPLWHSYQIAIEHARPGSPVRTKSLLVHCSPGEASARTCDCHVIAERGIALGTMGTTRFVWHGDREMGHQAPFPLPTISAPADPIATP